MNKNIAIISSVLLFQFPNFAITLTSKAQIVSQHSTCEIIPEKNEGEYSEEQLETLASRITVKVIGNNNGGSGTLLAKKGNTYLILTNNHVVRGVNSIKLKTVDGKTHTAQIVPNTRFEKFDLALLQFQSHEIYCPRNVENVANFLPDTTMSVTAAGFSGEKGEIVFSHGKIQKISQPLKEGYQIGYTSHIEQGMSGGAIIHSSGMLIGINGRGAYPILNSGYVYQNGSRPSEPEIQEMRKLSWGIPIATVLAEVNTDILTTYSLPLPKMPDGLPQPVLTGWLKHLEEKAKLFTVRIDSTSKVNGSGVIIAKNKNGNTYTYTVLTAAHIVCEREVATQRCDNFSYRILAPDGKHYPVEKSSIKTESGVDLAVVQFISNETYQVATLGNYQLNEIREVFVTGYPRYHEQSKWYFSPGLIFDRKSGLLAINQSDFIGDSSDKSQTASSLTGGYELVYTSLTYGGMGGGPVLDSQGRVIGIHGRVEGAQAFDEKTGDRGSSHGNVQMGYSLGIPVSTFLGSASRFHINFKSLKIEQSVPPKLDAQQLASFANTFATKVPQGNAPASQWLERGNLLWRINQFDEAISAFDKAIKLNPSFVYLAYTEKARVLNFQKKYKEAIAVFQQAIKSKYDNILAWRGIAEALANLSRYEESLSAINKAIKLQPNNPILYNDKFEILKVLKQYKKAESAINQAIQISPQAIFYYNRGKLYYEQKKWDLALVDFSKSIDIYPSFDEAYKNRGHIYYEFKKWNLALADYDQALKYSPDAEIYQKRGIIYYELGNMHKAIENYTQALKYYPDDADIYQNRAIARAKLGDKRGAIADIETAGQLYRQQNNLPGYQQALNLLRQFQKISVNNTSFSLNQSNYSASPLKPTEIDINRIAQQITVKIDDLGSDGNSFQGNGSGVIIGKHNNTYYVLTCAHVVPYEEVRKYQIVTLDNKRYSVNSSKVKKSPSLDIAILEFTSQENYPVATLANYSLEEFRWMFVAGWSNSYNSKNPSWLASPGLIFSQERGSLDTINSLSFTRGYELIYTNITYGGMSGGPLLDTQGRLIGIHGKTEGEKFYTKNAEKPEEIEYLGIELNLGYSLGIPISTFLSLTSDLKLNAQWLNIESTPPSQTNDFPIIYGTNINLTNDITKDKPKVVETLFRRGNHLWRLGKFEEANAAFDEIINLGPPLILGKVYYAKSLSLKYQKRYLEALYALDKAVKYQPDFYEAWRDRGEVLYRLKKYSEALSSIEEAIKLNNEQYDKNQLKDFVLDGWRGQLLYKLKQYSQAIEAYNEVIKIKPSPFIYLNRGLILADLQNYKEAIKDYTEAIKHKPNYAEAYFYRGIARFQSGDKLGAIKDYGQAIKINQDYAHNYLNLGLVLVSFGDRKEGINSYTELIDVKYAKIYKTRGLIRLEMGDKKGAIGDLQLAAEIYQKQKDITAFQEVLTLLNKVNQN